MLGGLAETQRDRSSGGIPFLSDIPLIGGIFGRKSRANNDFELFVFITPHVIYSDEDLQNAASGVRRNRPAIRRATERLHPLVGGEVPDDAADEDDEDDEDDPSDDPAAPAPTVPVPAPRP